MCLGTPGRVVRYVDDTGHLAVVDFAGTEKTVNMGMVADDDPPTEGDWVLVHMGIALQRVEPEEAIESQTFFDGLLEEFEAAAAAAEARTEPS